LYQENVNTFCSEYWSISMSRTKAPDLSVGPGGLIPSSLGLRPGPSDLAALVCVLHSVSNETDTIWIKFLTLTNQRAVFGIQVGNTSP